MGLTFFITINGITKISTKGNHNMKGANCGIYSQYILTNKVKM